MCVECSDNKRRVSHRETSVKHIQKVAETKQYIRSNGETPLSVEWYTLTIDEVNYYLSVILFEYFDGYQKTEDTIQVLTEV
jgi:hypothetical protein